MSAPHPVWWFFVPDPGPAQDMSVLIAATFIVALFILLRRTVQVGQEVRRVPAQSVTVDQFITNVRAMPALSPTRIRMEALLQYQGRAQAVDASEMVSAQQERVYDAALAWVRYFVSALLFLGLTGTVLGLASTIGGLKPILDSAHINRVEDLDNIVKAISGVIGAMRNAFACTLDGIAASLLTSLCAQSLLSWQQKKVLQPLDEYCARTLVPYLTYSPEYAAFSQAAHELSATVTAAAENTRAEKALQTELNTIISKMGSVIEALGHKMETSGKAVADSLTLAAKVTRDEMSSASRASSDSVLTASKALGAEMNRTTTWLREAGNAINISLQNLATTQEDVAKSIRSTEEAVAPLGEVLATLQKTAGLSLDSLQQAHQTGVEQTKDATARLEAVFKKCLQDLATASQDSDAQIRASASSIEDLLARHMDTFAHRLQSMEERQEKLLEAVSRFDGVARTELTRHGDRSLGVLQALVKSQESHATQMHQLSAQQREALNTLVSDLSTAVQTLKSLTESAEYAFRDAAQENAARGNQKIVLAPAPRTSSKEASRENLDEPVLSYPERHAR